MNSLEAITNLFTKKSDDDEQEELELPHYVDPSGTLMAQVRRLSHRYTADNVVQYAETSEEIGKMCVPVLAHCISIFTSTSATQISCQRHMLWNQAYFATVNLPL